MPALPPSGPDPASLLDDELFRAFGRGDAAVDGEFHRRFEPIVHAEIALILADPAERARARDRAFHAAAKTRGRHAESGLTVAEFVKQRAYFAAQQINPLLSPDERLLAGVGEGDEQVDAAFLARFGDQAAKRFRRAARAVGYRDRHDEDEMVQIAQVRWYREVVGRKCGYFEKQGTHSGGVEGWVLSRAYYASLRASRQMGREWAERKRPLKDARERYGDPSRIRGKRPNTDGDYDSHDLNRDADARGEFERLGERTGDDADSLTPGLDPAMKLSLQISSPRRQLVFLLSFRNILVGRCRHHVLGELLGVDETRVAHLYRGACDELYRLLDPPDRQR